MWNKASSRCTEFEYSPLGNVLSKYLDSVWVSWLGRMKDTSNCEVWGCCSVLVAEVLLISLCLSHKSVGGVGALVFSITSLQSCHLSGWQRELSHSMSCVQFQEIFSMATVEVWMWTEDLLFLARNQWWIDSQLNTKHTGLKVNLPLPS